LIPKVGPCYLRRMALVLREGEVALTTRIPAELRDRLKIEAVVRHTTMQDLIVELLDAGLREGRGRRGGKTPKG
jgi:hypothetical protein